MVGLESVELTLAALLVTMTVGATVSTVIVFSVAAALSLPAASVKTPAGTLIVPLAVSYTHLTLPTSYAV
mgnify:CR=1 FL=1